MNAHILQFICLVTANGPFAFALYGVLYNKYVTCYDYILLVPVYAYVGAYIMRTKEGPDGTCKCNPGRVGHVVHGTSGLRSH